jgi:hypothetical protein
MSKVIIIKGKLLKGDKVEISYKKQESNISKPVGCSEENPNPPRKELKEAFAALAIHAALLGEFVSTALVPDFDNVNQELIKDFTVTGFTITGSEEDEGVIITAHKKLKNGKSLGFNTPTTRFSDESENVYPFMDQLIECVDNCKEMLTKHLNGEYGDDPQGSLEFPEQD